MQSIPWAVGPLLHGAHEIHVPISATRAYLALRLIGEGAGAEGQQSRADQSGSDAQASRQEVMRETLLQALKRKAWQNAPQLVGLALCGMPEALVPFRRDPPDVFLAASVLDRSQSNAAFLDGEGNALPVGYFRITKKSVDYIDTGLRFLNSTAEVANLKQLEDTLQRHARWARCPEVEVGDLNRGELLRIRPGAPGALPAKLLDAAGPSLTRSRRTAGGSQTARMASAAVRSKSRSSASFSATAESLPRTLDGEISVYAPTGWVDPRAVEDAHRAGSPPPPEAVQRMARIKARFRLDGEVIVVDAPTAEALMELHAAALGLDEGPELEGSATRAWLHLRVDEDEGLFALPDLMETGTTAPGWWSPAIHIGNPHPMGVALQNEPAATVWVPESIAWRLMARFPWVRAPDPVAWIHWAEAVKERDAPGAIWPPAQRAVAASADSTAPRKTSKSGKRAKPAAASTSAPGCMPIDPTCIVHADAPPT